MIRYEITGLKEMVDALDPDQWIDENELFKIVNRNSGDAINSLRDEYSKSFAQSLSGKKYKKSMKLAESISAFRRNRKGKQDPFFTVYVGPRWTNRHNDWSYTGGGNAAYWMEYGTRERFKANVKQGGKGKTEKGKKTGLKGVYGAKLSTGRIPGFGIIRKVLDEQGPQIVENLKADVLKYFSQKKKELGV